MKSDNSIISREVLPNEAMEPMIISKNFERYKDLSDLATELMEKSTALKASLPMGLREPLSKSIQLIDSYYSNLIEGNNIPFEDINKNDYCKAHIAVQEWFDDKKLGRTVVSKEKIREIHELFYSKLSGNKLRIKNHNDGQEYRIVGGKFRPYDFSGEKKLPVTGISITRFIDHFTEVYNDLPNIDYIMNIAAAHHCFLWIHPFMDNNGRIARLISHAMLCDSVNCSSFWSLSRALSRKSDVYKKLLIACDNPQQKEEALAEFIKFFLKACISEVGFISDAVKPDDFHQRISNWIKEEIENSRVQYAEKIYMAILNYGNLPRGKVPDLINLGEKQSSRITTDMKKHRIITSNSTRSPWQLAIPIENINRLFPGVF